MNRAKGNCGMLRIAQDTPSPQLVGAAPGTATQTEVPAAFFIGYRLMRILCEVHRTHSKRKTPGFVKTKQTNKANKQGD